MKYAQFHGSRKNSYSWRKFFSKVTSDIFSAAKNEILLKSLQALSGKYISDVKQTLIRFIQLLVGTRSIRRQMPLGLFNKIKKIELTNNRGVLIKKQVQVLEACDKINKRYVQSISLIIHKYICIRCIVIFNYFKQLSIIYTSFTSVFPSDYFTFFPLPAGNIFSDAIYTYIFYTCFFIMPKQFASYSITFNSANRL